MILGTACRDGVLYRLEYGFPIEFIQRGLLSFLRVELPFDCIKELPFRKLGLF